MLPQIQIQTPDGVKAYLFAKDSVAYEQAIADGVLIEGMDIVYRKYLAHLLSDMTMLMLVQIMPDIGTAWSFAGGPNV